jgi:hypothetical protein
MTISATTQGIKPGVCTSTNRPVNPFDGQVIYMTDVDQTAVWDGSQWTVLAPIAGGRNAIINGAMKVWQRGTSFTSFNAYAADRWYITGSSNFTFSRQVPGSTLPQFAYCSRMQRNSGSTDVTSAQLGYTLETADSLRFVGKTITVSFWARAGANYSGTSNGLYYVLATGTGTDQRLLGSGFTGTAYSVISLVTLTTSWQRFSYTTTVPSTATEISHYFQANLNAGTAGANDYWDVTGVQLEEGAVATPFEFEDYSQTLQKCQRYYYRIKATANNYALSMAGQCYAATGAVVFVHFPVTMRIPPTALEQSGTATDYKVWNAGTSGVNCNVVPTFNNSNNQQSTVEIGVASGLVAGNATTLLSTGSAAYLGWSAEL